ncbi:MAG: endonuclease III, partial [Clostridia bacterium]|nr:endonuclease III [Clostridia bacterium]
VVADTHCIRISNRLGFSDSDDPYKTELALTGLIPAEKQSDFCHRIVLFGREICDAKKPKCGICPIISICPSYNNGGKSQ